jgi:L-iditol 2-dehydrogenase
MKVAMYYSNEDVRVEEMERPAPGPGEAVMKVMASGICGTDVMYWYRAHKVPMVLGHEVAGEIVEVGEGVTKLRPGDRVVAAHHVPCGSCHYCSDNHESVCDTLRSTNFHPGGFAEYLRLPKINVDMGTFPMPKDMSFDEGTFVEPLACVLRAQRAGRVSEGKSVLVIGSGISGLLHVALARARGAGFVTSTDLVPFRLDLARKAGAGLTLDARGDVPSAFIEANGERGADTVILTAGAPAAIAQAFESVDRGGTIVFFAPASEGETVPLPVNKLFWKQEVTLTSTYAASPAEHVEAMGLISSGRVRVEDLVTHVLPLEDAQEGFRLVSGGGDSAKVIIRPNG